MDSFYLIVLGIATVFLILMLAFITYAMISTKNDILTPMHDAATGQYTNSLCPDYWEYDADNQVCKYPDQNIDNNGTALQSKLNMGVVDNVGGASTDKAAVYTTGGKHQFTDVFKKPGSTSNGSEGVSTTSGQMGIKPDPTKWTYYGDKQLDEVCSKYQWSKDTGIHWSGYSNANQCA